MFTPQEVSEKVFPKASFGGGYSMSAVDEFLDALTEDYSTLFKENVTLKAKLKVLAEKVEEYRATEDAMRSTLLTAQKVALVRAATLRCSVPYALEGLLRRELQHAGATLLQAEHGQFASLLLRLPADQSVALQQRINDLTQGRAFWSGQDM